MQCTRGYSAQLVNLKTVNDEISLSKIRASTN